MARYSQLEREISQNRNTQTQNNNQNITNREGLYIQGIKVGERVHRRRLPLIRISIIKIATSIPPNSILVSQNRNGTKIRKVGKIFGIGFNALNWKRWTGRLYLLDLSEKVMNIDIDNNNPATSIEGYDVIGKVSVSFKIQDNPTTINKLLSETSVNEQFLTNTLSLVKQLISSIPWDVPGHQAGQTTTPLTLPDTSDLYLATNEILQKYGIKIGAIRIEQMTPVNEALRNYEDNARVEEANREVARRNAENERNIAMDNAQNNRRIEEIGIQTQVARANALIDALLQQGYTQQDALGYLKRISTPNNAVIIEGNQNNSDPALMMALNILSQNIQNQQNQNQQPQTRMRI